MSIKGIVSVVIASTALLTGLASYTSAVYSNKLEQFVSEKNKIDGVNISIIDRSNGFFARNQTYQITLSPQFINDKTGKTVIDEMITLYVPHHFVAFPLYVMSDLNVIQTKGSPVQWLQNLKIESVPHHIKSTTNLLLQQSTFELSLLPFTYDQDSNIINHQGMTVIADTDLQFKTGDITIDIDDIDVKLANDIQFSLSKFHSESAFEKYNEMYMFTSGDATLAHAKFVDTIKSITMEITDLETTSSMSSMDNNHIDMGLVLDIGSIVTENAVETYHIKNTEVVFSAAELDKKAYFAFEKLSRQIQPEKSVIDSALIELVRTGGQAKLSKLNFNLNQVQFKSDAEFSLPTFQGKLAIAEIDKYFMANFSLNINLAIANSYREHLHQIKPMLDHFINQGFAKGDKDGNVSSTVIFKQGQLIANDKALQM